MEIDPSQKNLNDEFLLALSGQIPIDKLLKRLAMLKGAQLWHQVDQSEFLAKTQPVQGSATPGGVASERVTAAPDDPE